MPCPVEKSHSFPSEAENERKVCVKTILQGIMKREEEVGGQYSKVLQ